MLMKVQEIIHTLGKSDLHQVETPDQQQFTFST